MNFGQQQTAALFHFEHAQIGDNEIHPVRANELAKPLLRAFVPETESVPRPPLRKRNYRPWSFPPAK